MDEQKIELAKLRMADFHTTSDIQQQLKRLWDKDQPQRDIEDTLLADPTAFASFSAQKSSQEAPDEKSIYTVYFSLAFIDSLHIPHC